MGVIFIIFLLGLLFFVVLSVLVALYYAFEKKAGTGKVEGNESKDYKIEDITK